MRVQVFALLKEYFEGQFDISTTPTTISSLREQLVERNPEARAVLSISRFAVNDEFVDDNFLLTENETVFIIPPSSGG